MTITTSKITTIELFRLLILDLLCRINLERTYIKPLSTQVICNDPNFLKRTSGEPQFVVVNS
jgi:hypothetical protein